MDLNKRLSNMLLQFVYFAGFAHCMPLIADATSGQHERIIRIDIFGLVSVFTYVDNGLARGCRKVMVSKQPAFTPPATTLGCSLPGVRPLHRTSFTQDFIAEPRYVDSGSFR